MSAVMHRKAYSRDGRAADCTVSWAKSAFAVLQVNGALLSLGDCHSAQGDSGAHFARASSSEVSALLKEK